jgi:DNA-directed RNA polymerase specialized sigma24 family protein
MKKDFTLTQQDFDALLGWLSPNREQAAEQYEIIRSGLIRFFRFRGCADPQSLADETINRVAAKVSVFDSTENVKTISYFYGFASNIYLEYVRTVKRREVQLEPEYLSLSQNFRSPDSSNIECDCLEDCLTKIPREESSLVIQYYGQEKSEKIELRKKLAEKMNVKLPALHTRVFRIRNSLKECIEKCLKEKSL